jgi:hypothetical protein
MAAYLGFDPRVGEIIADRVKAARRVEIEGVRE